MIEAVSSRQPAPQGRLEAIATCLYCGHGEHQRAVSGVEDWFFHNVAGGYDFERCSSCESLWISARLTPENLLAAYSSYYTHAPSEDGTARSGLKARLRDCYVRDRFGGRSDLVSRFGSMAYRRLASGRESVDMAYRFAPTAPARILDYGCGGGAYLRQMQALGHEVTGVDFDPVTLEPLRADGIAAYSTEELAQHDLAGSFDCITLNHVIEHVADPVELLAELFGMLKPGGMIYCESPNANATGLDVFGRFWRGLEAPRHLSVPSRNGLSAALSKAGFHNEQWFERDWVRPLIWPASLDAVPEDDKPAIERRMAQAPPQDLRNAEYLIVTAQRPL